MKKRIISGIVMAFITIPFLILGNLPFKIFTLILGEVALYEFLQFRKKIPLVIKIISYLLVSLIILKDLLGIKIELLLIISLVIYLSLLVFINNKAKYRYEYCFYLIGLTLFIGISFNNFIIIRDKSLYLFLYLLLITITTDSFALFIGTSIGKHKLIESISPNKTIEGFIGGSIVGTIFGSIFYVLLVHDVNNIFIVVLITLFLSIIGQLGDLIKSSIKRQEGVKDFSNLIPGHGGIMDRLDSIIFVQLIYILISNII